MSSVSNMNKSFTNALFIVILIFLLLFVIAKRSKTYSVTLSESGFRPQVLTINKGDRIKFSNILNRSFWPASDPHPTHVFFAGFDSKKEIHSNDTWTYEFQKSGQWAYHDHLDPSVRGQITVVETNPVISFYQKIVHIYKTKFIKHDELFLKRQNNVCNKSIDDHGLFLDCWTSFVADFTRDFGVSEAMRQLTKIYDLGFLTKGECHYLSVQVGTDAYWQFVSGKKFEFTKDFSLCDAGFFHHFMSEHVSHGKDFIGSENLCDSLVGVDKDLVGQCYFGMGNGLTYYYWNLYSNDSKKIVSESLLKCDKVKSVFKDRCVYGVYSGIDHIFEGQHGSGLTVNLNNPFELCQMQKVAPYKDSCYERMIPSISSALNHDVVYNLPVLNYWVQRIPLKSSKTAATRTLGRMISELEAVKPNPQFENVLNICRNEPLGLRVDCLWGAFHNILINSLSPTSKIGQTSCKDMNYILNNEFYICIDAQKVVEGLDLK